MLFYEYFINNTSRSFFGLVVILSGQTAQNTDSPVKDTKVPVSDASEAQPLLQKKLPRPDYGQPILPAYPSRGR